MKQKRNEVRNSPSSISSKYARGEGAKNENNPGGSSSGDEPLRRKKGKKASTQA